MSGNGIEALVVVPNPAGMHARPAAAFVKLAGTFRSAILLAKDGLEVNGKSIMGVLMLAAEQGSELRVRCQGEDEDAASVALVDLVARGFDETSEAL